MKEAMLRGTTVNTSFFFLLCILVIVFLKGYQALSIHLFLLPFLVIVFLKGYKALQVHLFLLPFLLLLVWHLSFAYAPNIFIAFFLSLGIPYGTNLRTPYERHWPFPYLIIHRSMERVFTAAVSGCCAFLLDLLCRSYRRLNRSTLPLLPLLLLYAYPHCILTLPFLAAKWVYII